MGAQNEKRISDMKEPQNGNEHRKNHIKHSQSHFTRKFDMLIAEQTLE